MMYIAAEEKAPTEVAKVDAAKDEPSPAKDIAEIKKEDKKDESPATAAQAPKQQDVPVSANAFASGSNPNGPQVMTGRPTSRVLMPGGGGGPVSWTLG
jgi:hypothetical protein